MADAVAGVLCDSVYGWPSVFYIFGAVGVVWYALWNLLMTRSVILQMVHFNQFQHMTAHQ